MTLKEAKDNLLKPVNTPSGELVLYGINCAPGIQIFGLYFYIDGKRKMYWNDSCAVIKQETA